MARILIVGCGCRGRGLATSLRADGHLVRGTTRDPGRLEVIRAAAGEAALADPDRLGTLLPQLAGVSVVCWLMGSAAGAKESVAALHGPRLQSLLSKLVDTPVRGIVYEAAGSVSPELLAEGGVAARAASATYRMPVRVVEESPESGSGWRTAILSAVEGILSA